MKQSHPQLLPEELVQAAARRFLALGQPTRLRLLDCLMQRGEASVQELSQLLHVPYPNVSRHLNLLRSEHVVGRRKSGTSVYYFIADQTVLQICQLVCEGLRAQLRALGAIAGIESPRGFESTPLCRR